MNFETEMLKMMQSHTIKLNPDQRKAYEYMAQGKSVFITGAAGTGKTSIVKMFAKLYKASKNIAVVSTTGTSAILINGTTLHSYLGIGLGNGSVGAMSTKILKKPYLRKRWRELEVLVIDEISMLSPALFDKLEEIARIVRGCLVRPNTRPFGGIQLILSGDFLQLPCINSNNFCFDAEKWKECISHTINLTTIIRQGDTVFQECLNDVRVGNLTEKTINILESRVGIVLTNDYGIRPTQLFPLNRDVDKINESELCCLGDVDFYEYNMEISIYSTCKNKKYAMERYKKYTTATEKLMLALGAQVMLIHNLDLECKLANGSRGVVTGFVDDLPRIKFVNGEERVIDYHIWEVEERDVKMMRVIQIPLKLAWATSIHRSQGCSLDYVEIDLENIFEQGQAYCALSRVKSLEGLSIISLDLDKIRAHPEAVEYYKKLSLA